MHLILSFVVFVTGKDNKKVTYTYDGRSTDKVANLVVNSDLIITESYFENAGVHRSVKSEIELFSNQKQRNLRQFTLPVMRK